MTRPVPQACLDFIEAHEGLRLTAYQDSGGVWTIGWGSAHDVLPNETITYGEALARLEADTQTAAEALAKVINPDVIAALTDNQWSATVDFAFNLGTGSPPFPIWALYNAKQYDQIPSRMQLYVNAGGRKLQGLVQRRADEAVLWGTDEPGSAPVALSSAVTRTVATPPVPLDPKPKGLSLVIGAAGTMVAGAIPQAQNAVQVVSDAITPYKDSAQILGHVFSALAVTGAGLAVAVVAVKYLHDRQVSQPPKSTAPALHPTSFASESNVNPIPGAQSAPPPGATVIQPATFTQAPSQPVVPSGAGSTITADLADLRDSIARCLTKLSGEAQSFAGKTVSEIIAEAKKLAASVESKL